MNGAELQKAIDRLGLSQQGLARLFMISPRRVRYWIADERPVPAVFAMLINLMLKTRTRPEDLQS